MREIYEEVCEWKGKSLEMWYLPQRRLQGLFTLSFVIAVHDKMFLLCFGEKLQGWGARRYAGLSLLKV